MLIHKLTDYTNGVPHIGALLGTQSVGTDFLDTAINRFQSNDYFGTSKDKYAGNYNTFITNYVQPIGIANMQVNNMIQTTQTLRSEFYAITNDEDLRNIHPYMMPAVLTYEPIYKLLRQGKIEGWGYTYDEIKPVKAMYDRLVETNGVVIFDEANRNEDGTFTRIEIYKSSDIEMSHEERMDILETRSYLKRLLEDTNLDPTNLDELRG